MKAHALGNTTASDAMIHDGLWCSLENWSMGLAGEAVADQYGVTRDVQDRFAFESHRKASKAMKEGWFQDEIMPVEIPQRRGDPEVHRYDESVRNDTSIQALSKLKPAFKDNGSVTAGNAPGVNDGAAALVLMSERKASSLNISPLVRIIGQSVSGLAPKWLLMTPVQAVRKLLTKVGWTMESVDLIEINEAFASQAVAVIKELEIDPDRVNVYGGAIALGHPIGASGARILTTLVYALRRQNLNRGIATLCLGGGNGVALAIER